MSVSCQKSSAKYNESMSQTEETSVKTPFNWDRMSLGEQKCYIQAADTTMTCLKQIMEIAESFKGDDFSYLELEEHLVSLGHAAKMSASYLGNQISLCQKDGPKAFSEEEKAIKDVHTEHCCGKHGCKYGYETCTVSTGLAKQSFPCESCNWDKQDKRERYGD